MTRVWYSGDALSTLPDPDVRIWMDAGSGKAPSERPPAPTMGTPRQATSSAGASLETENPQGVVPTLASR